MGCCQKQAAVSLRSHASKVEICGGSELVQPPKGDLHSRKQLNFLSFWLDLWPLRSSPSAYKDTTFKLCSCSRLFLHLQTNQWFEATHKLWKYFLCLLSIIINLISNLSCCNPVFITFNKLIHYSLSSKFVIFFIHFSQSFHEKVKVEEEKYWNQSIN